METPNHALDQSLDESSADGMRGNHRACALNLSIPTVSGPLKRLAGLEIAKETTGRERGRIFAYTRYLEIISAGTEPIPA
jgi:DNA-binding transcriptional ArsR family regulator